MKTSDIKKQLALLQEQQELVNRQGELNRARSVSVGSAFGGVTEVSMRGNGGATLWCLMQPVEVVELIHQLSANIGCHISIKPRDDFSSWREWKVSEEAKTHLNGHPPFPNELPVNAHHQLPPVAEQPGLNIKRSNKHAVAIKKTVNPRSAKHPSKTT